MNTYLSFLNDMANNIEKQHTHSVLPIKWFHSYRSLELSNYKDELIESMNDQLQWKFKNTKPFINSISKGCQLCGDGEWSCLFITGICNANCFYCPAPQASDDLPQSQKLLFTDAAKYVDYINKFNFKGVSFSGGEPLLYFDRTLEFITQVRKNCNPDIYIWMYTNGILATDEKFEALAKAGLNEIRFDLGAVNYKLDSLKNASKYIEHVTVEIPAVPHEKDKLLAILPLLCNHGVTNLNLHQLRLTSYNAPKLLQHDYTYLHGEQPTVVESELTAYEIIKYVADNRLPIGVNYCNFQFKNRFQKAGFRIKMALEFKLIDEEITQNGFLRKIEVLDAGIYTAISLSNLSQIQKTIHEIKVTYQGRIIENIENSALNKCFTLNNTNYSIVEGLSTVPVYLNDDQIDQYLKMMGKSSTKIPDDIQLFEIWKSEFIEEELREYF